VTWYTLWLNIYENIFLTNKFGHAEAGSTCKLFSFYLTIWLYSAYSDGDTLSIRLAVLKIRINYLCTITALLYSQLFPKVAFMTWFRCRNGVTNKIWWPPPPPPPPPPPQTLVVPNKCSAHTVLTLKCRTCEKLGDCFEITVSLTCYTWMLLTFCTSFTVTSDWMQTKQQ
jgi:hypothetical protein